MKVYFKKDYSETAVNTDKIIFAETTTSSRTK